MPITVTLDHADALDHSLVGGKGANLARTSQAGFPVPAAFAVTTEAYRRFVSEAALRSRIEPAVAAFEYDGLQVVDEQSRELRAAIEGAEVPAEIAAEIVAAYEALGPDRFVAVRSSGTAEDLADASFAGHWHSKQVPLAYRGRF